MEGREVAHYRIVDRLGGGGMGDVYKAEDTRLGRSVALKFLHRQHLSSPDGRARFEREVRAVSTLNHPNICSVHDAGEFDGQPYLVMELLEGKPLSRVLQDGAPLDPGQFLDLARQLCQALEAAHAKGVIHRDIKPSNIFLTESGHAKVLDFGLAKRTPDADTEAESPAEEITSLTGPGMILGTVAYMAPEQALGREVDHRSDLFSLGVVLYEMATGIRPFSGKTAIAAMDELLHKDPVSVLALNREMPAELETFFGRALEKNPKYRYQSASEMHAELVRIENRLISSGSLRSRPGLWASRKGRRRLVRWGILSLLVLMLVSLPVFVPEVLDTVRNWTRGFQQAASVAERVPLVAIMPFEVVQAAGRDQQEFSEGLARDLTLLLDSLEQTGRRLVPIPYRLVRELTTPAHAHRELGVDLVITGSIASGDEEMVCWLTLIDARTNGIIASDRLTGPTADRNGLAEMIQQASLRMLRLRLVPGGPGTSPSPVAEVPDLFGVFLEGRGFAQRYDQIHYLQEALERFEQVTRQAPLYAPAFAALAEICPHLFRHFLDPQWIVRGEEAARRAILLDSRDPQGHTALGFVLLEKGEYQQALESFDRALAIAPDYTDARRGRADTLNAAGRSDEAEALYLRMVDEQPGVWMGHHELARFNFQRGRYEEALAGFEVVRSLLPDSCGVRNRIAAVHLQMGRPAVAEAVLRASLAIDTTYEALDYLGTALYHQGQLASAAEQWEAALKLNESNYVLWGNLAGTYRQLGKDQEAERCYRKAVERLIPLVEVNPREVYYRIDLSDYLVELGEVGRGLEALDRAMELPRARSEPDVLALAGQICEKAGQRERAIFWTVEALKLGYPRSRIEGSLTLQALASDPAFREAAESATGIGTFSGQEEP